ncbi:tubulin glycylase 3A-like [Copidosoma floridanum]|uniref:tubulin glycylase 3A-like n=1 Tax=Copidosoma floridanum TaxID=29053 RepID=UPI0006C978D6|nr:tubulin glycylase 3A-like [Copidosoma floridanum]
MSSTEAAASKTSVPASPVKSGSASPTASKQQETPVKTTTPSPSPPTRHHHPNQPAHPNQQQMEHFQRIKRIVKSAIAERKTFMICGRARVIRECLLARGWCEKYHRRSVTDTSGVGDLLQLSVDSNPSALMAGIGNLAERQNERLLVSRMLSNHTVDFLWNAGSVWTGWPSQDNKTTIFNRYARANFTSKVGLCSNVRQMHWYYEAGIANTLFPRCYNISQSDQLHAFIDDFRLTACLSLLKWFAGKVAAEGEESVRAANGVVPMKALDFALGRCSDLLGSKSHEDIDQDLEKVWSHQWEQFITWYYKLVHGNALLINNGVPLNKYALGAQNLLKRLKKYWPQLDMDGTMNIWILKPGNKSRGRGIALMNKLDDIMAKVNPTNKATDTRFVVQKYIERPLLIYNTKFDIRQWFIITNAQPLTIWMYKESYLRFCSQTFSLTNFHESIHLSNNAVQCKYKNSPDRDAALPAENMWDIAAFKEYLRGVRGNEDAWDKMIYPGMKEGLVGSLLASQEAMDQRKNSFELYGADFMVMEDFSVWLIEINSHPDMSNSTSVTTRLCRKAMEDTIKVVIDHRENSNADTGGFELVYKQKLSSCQAYLGSALSLQGTRISFSPGDVSKRSSTNSNTTAIVTSASLKKKRAPLLQQQQQTAIRVGPVLVDLMEELEMQLDNEFYEYLKLRTPSGMSRQIPALREAPPARADLVTGQVDPVPSLRSRDVETSTATPKSVHLQDSDDAGETTMPRATKSSLPLKAGTEKSAKSCAKNYSSKRRTKTSQARRAELPESSLTSQTTRMLISRIEDMKKEGAVKNKAAFSSTTIKSNRVAKVDKHSIRWRSRVAYYLLSMCNKKNNQVLINVSDLYAVGLAVNK